MKGALLFRSAASFFTGTAFSKISGFARDIVMAWVFGASSEIAAFFVAYRFANLFRRLFGEGNVSAVFVPKFLEMKEKSFSFYREVYFSFALMLLGAVFLLELLCIALESFAPPMWKEVFFYTKWMLPGLFFICLYGLKAAYLQSQNRFFKSAFAPAIFNLVWIFALLWSKSVFILALAVVCAFAAQWLFLALGKNPKREKKKPLRLFSPGFKAAFNPLFLGIIGIAAVQINTAFDAIFARFADPKGPAYLWYAVRIYQLPISLFAIALSNASLPILSREEDGEKKKISLDIAMKKGAFIALVCTFGVFLFSQEIISCLFGYGGFGKGEVLETAKALVGYALGLVPATLSLLLATYHYSKKEYRIPMKASLWSVGFNIALNTFFVFGLKMGALSIALATSISSFCNMAFLAKGVFCKGFFRFFLQGMAMCLFAASAVFSLRFFGKGFSGIAMMVPLAFIYLGISFLFIPKIFRELRKAS